MSHLRGDYGSPSLQLDRNFDDITCPPPPSHAKSDAQKLRWKKRHMGLLRRAQTLPSNARISAMFGVSVAVAVVPWAFIRRYGRQDWAQPRANALGGCVCVPGVGGAHSGAAAGC